MFQISASDMESRRKISTKIYIENIGITFLLEVYFQMTFQFEHHRQK